ncbi:diacylglycerol/lipid kinase family protein [Sphingomonas oligophenolica]|uniref:DAGKc domain-containing protein n=1 Tax=Sphingomonas oligophenolica TaxID=301154 RepID=A0A502CHM2_9SPHN|nr:diacylglycerol kinase family protein [Sphingomonas oligophenolica]TPG12104.1 hypothetical protein EAH84_10130 [Sphingomonas oligophenolica]
MSGLRVPVIVNRDGGTAAALGEALADSIAAAFAEAGVAIDLRLVAGCDVKTAVHDALGAAIVVVGGGDGTLGCAADILAGTETALGILPVGTRNHLARDLGVPLDLPGAAALIASGAIRPIDLARANGEAFINNASIGLYPSLVIARDAERKRLAIPKWLAALPASFAALKRIRHHRLRLDLPDSSRDIVTPMLFVGNNRYALGAGRLGQRAVLDAGTLSVFAVASRRRLALVGFALRMLVGRVDRGDDFAAIGDCPTLTVEGRSHDVDIALDGEVVTMTMPITFQSEPDALRVVAPVDRPA